MSRLPTFLFGAAAGAAAAHFLDPDSGARRRTTLRDRGASKARSAASTAQSQAKYAAGQAKGAASAVTPSSTRLEDADDVTLARKVETEIFRDADAPKGDVSVDVQGGDRPPPRRRTSDDWSDRLATAARGVDGIKGVKNLLHPPGHAGAGRRAARDGAGAPRVGPSHIPDASLDGGLCRAGPARCSAAVSTLSRRSFLMRAAALAGAAAGLGGLRLPAPALATAGTALSARREATCRALLAALRKSEGGRFRHRGAAAGARRFAAWYAAQPAEMRAHADAVLDAVEGYAPRAGALRGRSGGARPSSAEARRRATLLAAVALIEGADLPAGERTAVEGLA